MRALPIEDRGYPVPWFVEWIDGRPDFRVMDRAKWTKAIRFGNCWLCGEPLGKLRTFVIGPMCGINRTTSEPPCHLECAEFAVTACPFMLLPQAKRRTANLPADFAEPAGEHLDRNPGAMALWTTCEFSVFRVQAGGPGNPGQLIHLGEPRTVAWYAHGRAATREEVLDSIAGGFPTLEDMARSEGQHALDQLYSMRAIFSQWLPE